MRSYFSVLLLIAQSILFFYAFHASALHFGYSCALFANTLSKYSSQRQISRIDSLNGARDELLGDDSRKKKSKKHGKSKPKASPPKYTSKFMRQINFSFRNKNQTHIILKLLYLIQLSHTVLDQLTKPTTPDPTESAPPPSAGKASAPTPAPTPAQAPTPAPAPAHAPEEYKGWTPHMATVKD